LSGHQHLADIFGITKILQALDALESGDYSPCLYDTIGDAWDIEERTFAALAEHGFSPALATDAAAPHAIRDLLMRPLSTFSGGQTVTAARAALLVHDMQRYFVRAFELERDGQPLPGAQINIAIANIRRLLDAAHVANIPVYYTAQPPRHPQIANDVSFLRWF